MKRLLEHIYAKDLAIFMSVRMLIHRHLGDLYIYDDWVLKWKEMIADWYPMIIKYEIAMGACHIGWHAKWCLINAFYAWFKFLFLSNLSRYAAESLLELKSILVEFQTCTNES